MRVLSVPVSDRFPEGIKYAFHYGEAGADQPTVRYDNHHGLHEVHRGSVTEEVTFPGLHQRYRRWRRELPEEKRADW